MFYQLQNMKNLNKLRQKWSTVVEHIQSTRTSGVCCATQASVVYEWAGLLVSEIPGMLVKRRHGSVPQHSYFYQLVFP